MVVSSRAEDVSGVSADYFRVSLDYLAGRSNVQNIMTQSDLRLSDHERMVIRRYRELSAVEQAMICRQLELPHNERT